MNWRLASRLSVITLALLVVLVVAILGTRNNANSANSTSLQGTDLGSTPAQNFRLTDQFGKQVSLSDFKGKPVVLTFLYTLCPDVCPLTAEKLHTVMQNLGSNAQNVAVLAVSLDPKGDTPASVLNFSRAHNMLNYWHYLTGTQNQLTAVWKTYGLFAQPVTPTANDPETVSHNTALYVIDKQGRERVFLPDDFTPAQLTSDLKILLRQ